MRNSEACRSRCLSCSRPASQMSHACMSTIPQPQSQLTKQSKTQKDGKTMTRRVKEIDDCAPTVLLARCAATSTTSPPLAALYLKTGGGQRGGRVVTRFEGWKIGCEVFEQELLTCCCVQARKPTLPPERRFCGVRRMQTHR